MKKIKLEKLKVQSFITLDSESQKNIKGGDPLNTVRCGDPLHSIHCTSAVDACVTAWNCTITRGIIC